MNIYAGALLLTAMLAGCKEESNTAVGEYLIEDVSVVYEFDKDIYDEAQLAQEKRYQSSKNNTLVAFADDSVSWASFDEVYSQPIKNGLIVIGDVTYRIDVASQGEQLTLTSAQPDTCGWSSCEITFRLKRAEEGSPELKAIKNEIASHEQARHQQLLIDQAYIKSQLDAPFYGVMLSLDDAIALKVPINLYNGVASAYVAGLPEDLDYLFTNEKLQAGSVGYQNWKNEAVEGMRAYLYSTTASVEDIDLQLLLKHQRTVVYQDNNGAIYYDHSGKLKAVSVSYHPEAHKYFFGLITAPDIETVTKGFNILRTANPASQAEGNTSVNDLALSNAESEEKYNTSVRDYFDTTAVNTAILERVTTLMAIPQIFVNPVEGCMEPVEINGVKPSLVNKEIGIDIFNQPVKRLIAADKRSSAGTALPDIVYNTDRFNRLTYRYYVAIGQGITLRVNVPLNGGALHEKVMFLHALRTLDFTGLPSLPEGAHENIHRYHSAECLDASPFDHYFHVDEGIIDRQGNLINRAP